MAAEDAEGHGAVADEEPDGTGDEVGGVEAGAGEGDTAGEDTGEATGEGDGEGVVGATGGLYGDGTQDPAPCAIG